MAGKVKLDPKGLEAVAKRSETASAVKAIAEKVAENIKAQGIRVEGKPGDVALPVEVNTADTTNMRVNRAKAWVMLAHPAGMAVQAKHGALTKAAAQAGLKVEGN